MTETTEASGAQVQQQLPPGIDLAALLQQAIGVDPTTGKIAPPGTRITGDEVEFHDGIKISLPRNMTFEKAYAILKRLQEEAETPTEFSRIFRYRADDGAFAAFQVMKARFGMLMGKPMQTFFGLVPAETRTINIGVDQKMQLPWGLLEIPIFPGLQLNIGEVRDKEYGKVFGISATGPRKFKDDMEEFFNAVEEYLRTNSIYRGKAIVGSAEPDFLDLRSFKREQVVFSDEVETLLDGMVYGPLRYTESMRRNNVPLKRTVLLHGPYGTGKTSAGQITALEATDNGWTFISARPGRDKIEDVLRTARLYQPAVVFVEDIDNESDSGEGDDVTKLLDAFDGITAKGGELFVVMTTNHIERIHKGMLRPGRLDGVIEIAALDRHGIERLIKAVIDPTKLDSEVDYGQVGEAMYEFLPAFVRESITRAVSFAISRLEGHGNYIISTEDLVNAAHSLRPQLDAQQNAGEGVKRPTLDLAMKDSIREVVDQSVVKYNPRGTEWAIAEATPENADA
jgi:transitional endoplasmic reticulum ATPase